jgi:hypothetical protein
MILAPGAGPQPWEPAQQQPPIAFDIMLAPYVLQLMPPPPGGFHRKGARNDLLDVQRLALGTDPDLHLFLRLIGDGALVD